MRIFSFLLLLPMACAAIPESDTPEASHGCSDTFACERAYNFGESAAVRKQALLRWCDELDDKHGCLALARAYADGDVRNEIAKDLPRALATYDRTCAKSDVACLFSGYYREKNEGSGDPGPWFEKACRAGANAPDDAPCTKGARANPSAASELHKMGCERRETESCLARAKELLDGGRRSDAAKLYSDTCFFRKNKDACVAAAQTSDDAGEVSLRLRDACDYGDAESCTRLAAIKKEDQRKRDEEWNKATSRNEKTEPKTTSTGGGGTQFTMGSASVNGMTIKNTNCTGLQGGLFGALGITAVLGDRASAIRACGLKGSVHVSWSSDGKTIKSVTTSPSNACVQAAVQSMKVAMAGSCSADLSF